MTSTHRRRSPRSAWAAGLVLAALVSACSSAPAPTSLDQDNTGTGPTAAALPTTPGGTPAPGATTPGAPGSSGVPTTPGGVRSTQGVTLDPSGEPVLPPGATHSTLFTPQEDVIGITPTQLTMCAHAALTYGAAFNTTDADFNVFWSELNSKGGIWGRQIVVTYENDNYTAADAKTAATACKAKNPFMILGGIGFDQIPAVRNYVEQEHVLYLHHTATVAGTAGQKYSFSELPTVERFGDSVGQLVVSKFRNKKVGIIERDSPNWSPGSDAFKAKMKAAGIKIYADVKVVDKQANYTDAILAMKNANVDLVFGWENALNATELIKQAKAQLYSPQWVVFGINLMSQTIGDDALSPPIVGAVMYTPYSFQDYSGPFARYADDVKEFEAEYKKWRPNADLSGVGGDLLFLNWQAQKGLAVQLKLCGKSCTRNKFIDVLQSYDARPTSSACDIDFVHSDGHHGATQLNWVEAYKSPSGKVNFRNFQACVDK